LVHLFCGEGLRLSRLRSSILPRPFLKWVGGKGQLLSQILPLLPKEWHRYHEPFLGGGALFFALQPARSVLSDVNPALVNVYQMVRDRPEALIEQLAIHQQSHSADYYYHIRGQHDLPELEAAARLIYLNKTCYNGLYRENSKGQFNVPIGRYKNPTVCHADELRLASQALAATELRVGDFMGGNVHWGPEDLIYFDPPYHPLSETSNFTGYSRFGFGAEDQIRLRDRVIELANMGVKVMVSNSDCPFIRDIYQDFRIETIEAGRSINSDATKRGKITEVVVLSWP
jgi:DNA adenine methylase